MLAALAVSACDFPTEPPMWEQTWQVEGEEISLGVADVLPTDVTLSADGSEFEASIAGTSFELSLGEMCADCAALNGLVVPKPEFSHSFSTTLPLPASLVSATLTGDQFALNMAHNLNFDPLRPSADPGAERGFIVIEVTSGATIVARDTIHGDDVSFAPDVPLTPVIGIRPGDVSGDLGVDVFVFSPAGDAAEIDTADSLGIEILPADLTLSQVTVEAGAIAVNADAAELDLSGVDSTLVNRVQSGALRLDISNPFDLEGTLQLEFDLGTSTIQKSFVLAPGTSSAAMEFTGDELQDLLEAGTVAVTASGTLGADGGTITVQPDDTMTMSSRLELVILVGGSTEEDGV